MTETTEQTETEAVVDAYLAALTEADPVTRGELIRRAWTEDGYFVDPLLEAEGHQALADLAPVVIDQFPGHTFRRTTDIDSHHGLVRFNWELVSAEGVTAAKGLDVGVLAADGRLSKVAGFFDEVAGK